MQLKGGIVERAQVLRFSFWKHENLTWISRTHIDLDVRDTLVISALGKQRKESP